MYKALGARLRGGIDLDDAEFDTLYPTWGRRMSFFHWTPVAVARRAAAWLVGCPGTRVLDVGAGVGKFAIVGSLVTDGSFYGVERRRHFVDAAQTAARGVGASTAHFVHGNMVTLDWGMFDAFYLYNPFLEDVEGPWRRDQRLGRERDSSALYIEFVRGRLQRAPIGTRVVTYHGFGGDLPGGYLRADVPDGIPHLECWIKGSEPARDPAAGLDQDAGQATRGRVAGGSGR